MFTLNNSFAIGRFTVAIVGCGGTGGFAAEGLCRILPLHADLVLVDHDRVEEANLGRQNFTRDELGLFKSETLAKRLAMKFSRPVAYSILPISIAHIKTPGLVIGCVDNGPARRDIAEETVWNRFVDAWWVDAGNGENFGQVLIGNYPRGDARHKCFNLEERKCYALPLPTLQRPDILAQRPPERDCARAVAAREQGPVINQAMASLLVEVGRRIIEGTCPWMQLHLDLEAGTLSPILATPDAVAKIIDKRKRRKRSSPVYDFSIYRQ